LLCTTRHLIALRLYGHSRLLAAHARGIVGGPAPLDSLRGRVPKNWGSFSNSVTGNSALDSPKGILGF